MTPDKGRGLFAVVNISRGTRLLVEDPLVTITPPPLVPSMGFSLAVIEPLVAEAYAQLTRTQKEQYLSCHEVRFGDEGKDEESQTDDVASVPSGRLLRILRSNAYNTRDGRVGLYPLVALINHDCRPNVLNTDLWVPETLTWQRIIVAARDIAAGEEIVTTYVPLLADTATRRSRLSQYGFTCMCKTCAASSSHEDGTRVRMRQILDALEELEEQPAPNQSPEILAGHAADLAAYIAGNGFVDYAVGTSRLAAVFAGRAGDTETASYWTAVHRANLALAGEDIAW
ncbi:SET domain-containing protein 5 [Sporothrix bragantina]|uniref:SET domain-containing protein 5 n=1 Tax=Sporothrix bragantina TaxID=671064 RepID=A0ABP0BDT0_9PEZI